GGDRAATPHILRMPCRKTGDHFSGACVTRRTPMAAPASATPVPAARSIDVARFLVNQQLPAFNWTLVVACFFITAIDGYDIAAAPAAGPFFVREWHLASPAALTYAFSAANFGVLFGAPLFGWLGDRYGRKLAINLSLVSFGLFTLLVVGATSPAYLTR